MTDREKLIELLNMHCDYAGHVDCKEDCTGCLADHLLANGVTFAADTNDGGKWVQVSERLPECAGMAVLVVAENKFGQKHVVKAFTDYTGENGFLTNEKEYDLIWGTAWNVTHWMPLPEPPKEDSKLISNVTHWFPLPEPPEEE